MFKIFDFLLFIRLIMQVIFMNMLVFDVKKKRKVTSFFLFFINSRAV